MTRTPIFCLLTLFLFLAEVKGQVKILSYGEPCDPTSAVMGQCDPSRGFTCDKDSHTCDCYHEDRDIFNHDLDRCLTKVGKFCSPKESFCVPHAECNTTSHFCQCSPGFAMQEGEEECSKSAEIFGSALAIFLLVASVFLCS